MTVKINIDLITKLDSKKLKELEKSIEKIKKSSSSVSKSFQKVTDSVTKSQGDIRKISRGMSSAAVSAKEFSTAASSAVKNTAKIAKSIDKVDGKGLTKVTKGLKNIQKESKKSSKSLLDFASSFKANFTANIAASAFTTAVNAIKSSVTGVVTEFASFETGLIKVQKTTGLSGQALSKFGERIQDISDKTPLAATELLSIAANAGQLGVEGSENLAKYADTIGKVTVATDLTAETAALGFARILKITGEPQSNVDRLASTIVGLGNNFAALESEILKVSNEVARSTAQFNFSSAQTVAYGTALKELGQQAQLAGSVVGRALRAIQVAASDSSSKAGVALSRLTGIAQKDLKQAFEKDASAVFAKFIKGLNRAEGAGESFSSNLERLGLRGDEISKVIPVLAKRSDTLTKALALSSREFSNNTALNDEAAAAFSTLASQAEITKNAFIRLATDIGSQVAPTLDSILKFTAEAVTGFRELPGPITKTAASLIKLSAAIVVIGKLGAGVSALAVGLSKVASIARVIVSPFTALAAVFVTMAANADIVIDAINLMIKRMEFLASSSIVSVTKGLASLFGAEVSDSAKQLAEDTDNLGNNIKTLKGRLDDKFNARVFDSLGIDIDGTSERLKEADDRMKSFIETMSGSSGTDLLPQTVAIQEAAKQADKSADNARKASAELKKSAREDNERRAKLVANFPKVVITPPDFGPIASELDELTNQITTQQSAILSKSREIEARRVKISALEDGQTKADLKSKQFVASQELTFNKQRLEDLKREQSVQQEIANKKQESDDKQKKAAEELLQLYIRIGSTVAGVIGSGSQAIAGNREQSTEVAGQITSSESQGATLAQQLAQAQAALSAATTEAEIAAAQETVSTLNQQLDDNRDQTKELKKQQADLAKDRNKTIKEGSNSVVSGVSGIIADTIIPGLGSIVTPLLDAATAGPEAVTEFVNGIAEAIPELITSISEALPDVILAVANAIPNIVIGIISAIPAIVEGIVTNLPKLVLPIAKAFATVMAVEWVALTAKSWVLTTAIPWVTATAIPWVVATASPWVAATGLPWVAATAIPWVTATALPWVAAVATPFVTALGALLAPIFLPIVAAVAPFVAVALAIATAALAIERFLNPKTRSKAIETTRETVNPLGRFRTPGVGGAEVGGGLFLVGEEELASVTGPNIKSILRNQSSGIGGTGLGGETPSGPDIRSILRSQSSGIGGTRSGRVPEVPALDLQSLVSNLQTGQFSPSVASAAPMLSETSSKDLSNIKINGDQVINLLVQLLTEVKKPVRSEASLTLDGRELGEVLLELDRQNLRTKV